jgi:ABC-type antimicrobial peptide transport system permease subunit
LVRLVDYINSRTTFSAKGPNELWIGLRDTAPEDIYTEISLPLLRLGIRPSSTYIATDMISEKVTHPLLVAGWSGLLVLSFFTVVLASASSILLYSYMDSRERQMEFALLRTLGFTRGQLNGVVWFGLILMVSSGIVLGTWVGQLAGTAVLPLLEVAEQGTRVTPPMSLHINWQALFWYYAVLAVAAVATCGILARILARREIQQVLRIGGGA